MDAIRSQFAQIDVIIFNLGTVRKKHPDVVFADFHPILNGHCHFVIGRQLISLHEIGAPAFLGDRRSLKTDHCFSGMVQR